MRAVYIVLTDSGTLFTRLIKRYTKSPYNHAAIALDSELTTMYSFGRKHFYFPLLAGFVKERINEGIYKKLKHTTCVVYELPVSDRQFRRIVRVLERFERNAHLYTYNLCGLLNFLLPICIRRRSAFFCSEFVASVLKHSGVDVLPKPPSLTAPHDFMLLPQARPIYEGLLNDYPHHTNSMKKITPASASL